jgi:hypothetical protein
LKLQPMSLRLVVHHFSTRPRTGRSNFRVTRAGRRSSDQEADQRGIARAASRLPGLDRAHAALRTARNTHDFAFVRFASAASGSIKVRR